jgi:hypothetical protein
MPEAEADVPETESVQAAPKQHADGALRWKVSLLNVMPEDGVRYHQHEAVTAIGEAA